MEKVFALFEKLNDSDTDKVTFRQFGLYHETLEEAEKEVGKYLEWMNNPYQIIILPVYIHKKIK